ncbi:MAG TPA: hypothetical protein VKA70_16005 [Blastocatellia bacterium]|nr:hypothetical protein [Blastocatellia bacterium]
MSFYVIGGQQKERRVDEWRQYKKGMVVEVDGDDGRGKTCLEYVSPPEVCPDEDASIMFKAASLEDDKLYLCTATEVLVYEAPAFKRVAYVSLPCFNDLHHVCPTPEGNLLVASTGLDLVVEVDLEGRLVREWSALDEDTWARFSRDIDYRKVPTTKPHLAHPNYVFRVGEEVWTTRMMHKDAVCLTRPGARVEIPGEGAHDGIMHGGFIFFTTIDGHVVVTNQKTLKTEEVIDLNAIKRGGDTDQPPPLGWARGLMVEADGRIWVGFTRLRPTKFRENLSWIAHGFTNVHLPTRLALYDVYNKSLIKEIDTEPFGVNAIFSIISRRD